MRWLRRSSKEAASALRSAVGEFELPHFPGTTMQGLAALRNEDSTLEQIAETLCADPNLSVRVLSLVNSAGFGLRSPVDDLGHAVHLIGRSRLEALLISVGVRQSLPHRANGVEPHVFWRAASRRAATARGLAGLLCPSEANRSFTAALLQDMAVPLLAQQCGAEYAELLGCWRDGGPELNELEQDCFGWNHAEVGLLMCQFWSLPESLSVAIAGHHEASTEGLDIPDPVRLSALLREGDFTQDVDLLVETVEAQYGVARDAVIEILDTSFEDAEGLAALLA
jgi:HD-like signal output (HDOD) protein